MFAHPLTSLDATQSGAHGLNLAANATYSPETKEDEDVAVLDHRLDARLTTVSLYAPTSGLTYIVPRFRNDLGALLFIT